MSNVKGKGQRLIPEELLKYLEALKNKYPDAVDLVEANPTLEGGEDSLSSVLINGTKYAVGGGKLYCHIIKLTNAGRYAYLTLYNTSNTPFILSTLVTLLNSLYGVQNFPFNVQLSGNDIPIKGLTTFDNYINVTYYNVQTSTATSLNFMSLTSDTITEV